MINCCNGCVPPKRHIGCHATCEDYISEKKKHEKKLKEIRRRKKEDAAYLDSIIKNINRSNRK